ncbi:response regulator transcription factor [Paenibacillus fonticola]|uniref:response regulator transcription factor n=1 Tax=Paenibacillus fonticola TaxID=379896 RepID=UPI000373F900|nr:response regulator [Paenibacillus fonticola]
MMINELSLSTEYRWKVLIADDECIIREGIRESVDWERLRLNVAAEAEDGEEALELALKHRIDILLVDLNMPIMDGIELMKQVREELPDCKILIITGHDEFTYAQTAIRLQVKDYILKPANPAQLEKVLRQVRDELEEEAIQQQHLQTASRQITRSYPLLRERFCQEWMEGSMTEDEIVEQLSFLELPVTAPCLLGMIRLRESASPQPLMQESERQLYLFAIENIATELLGSYPKVLFRDPFGVIVVLLWSFSADAAFHQIESSVRTYLKVAVDIHLTEGDADITSMPAVYRKCKSSVLKETAISPLVRRAKQYMLENYGDCTLTLESMAQQLQSSPVYLSRMIKQELDTSFNSYLTQIRIRRASQLLNGTDLTIAEIARQVGYETQHYFSTAFKRTTGASPLQYRKGGAAQEE